MFTICASFFKSYGVKHYSTLTTLNERGKIFTLTLKGEDPHLLTPGLLESFCLKLDEVKSKATKGSVLITTAEGKNFCKGFPREGYHEVIDPFRQLVKDLISFPMPTIAAINGYAVSAGLILALSHDHLSMKPGKFVLSMTELDDKMPSPAYFTAMIRSKAPRDFARLASNNLSFDSKHAEQMGLAVLPRQCTQEEPLDTAKNFARHLSKKEWDCNLYAEQRKTSYPDLCNVLRQSCAPSSRL